MFRKLRKKKWCVATNFTEKHVFVKDPFESHYCAYDYCHCSFYSCSVCGLKLYRSDGVDECR